MPRSKWPEQSRTKATRSRCFGSMFAWTLKTKPVTAGSQAPTARGSAGCVSGGGPKAPMPAISSCTPKELIAEPNQIGERLPSSIAWGSNGGQQRARHLDLLAQPREQVGGHVLGHARVVEPLHLHAPGPPVAVGAVHQLELVVQHVVAAEEVAALADRPGGRADVELQLVLDLVDDLEGVAGLAVHLVAEGQDRQVAQPADLEELAGLALDALGAVDHHHRGVDRGQRAVGVLGEVRVAGGVDEVEPPVAERERHRRGGDRDAALLLDLHEVGAGAPRLALGAHLAGHLDRAAVEQELLGQRGLAGVGVRDDREGPAPGDLRRQGGGVADIMQHVRGYSRGAREGEGGGATPAGRAGPDVREPPAGVFSTKKMEKDAPSAGRGALSVSLGGHRRSRLYRPAIWHANSFFLVKILPPEAATAPHA